MKTSTLVWVVVVVVVIAGGAWWYLSAQPPINQPVTTTTTTNQGSNTGVSAGVSITTAPMSATVTYGPNGFSPSTVTIAKGGTVTFTAAPGADEMWVASAPHPSHTGYDGTSRDQHCASGYSGPTPFDQCAAGTTYRFTFGNAGSWVYHNHDNASDYGTVVVQ